MEGDIKIGRQKVDTAFLSMPGLKSLIEDYKASRPLKGVSILVCVTPTPQTGAFLITLQKLGAKLAACSDNAYASDDDVVVYLASLEIDIFAKSNMTLEEYFASMERAIAKVRYGKCLHIVDDGCDVTRHIIANEPELLDKVKIITEQTTYGINFLRSLFAAHKLPAPAININHSFIKERFDNSIGIQQSLIHAFSVAGISVPGKRIAIFGYGSVGQGAAQALQRLGARVSIVEPNIFKLMQAEFEGYTPQAAQEALKRNDICLTATGCNDTISSEMIDRYAKDKLILGNIGHGSKEYDVAFLRSHGSMKTINPYLDEVTFPDKRKVYSLCKGALVNFLAGGGNMARIMDITFTLTVLTHLKLACHDRLSIGLHQSDNRLEEECAKRSFSHLVPLLYELSNEQMRYLGLHTEPSPNLYA